MSDVLGFAAPEAPEVAEGAGPEWVGDVEVVDEAPEVPEAVVRGLLATLGVMLGRVLRDPDVPALMRFTSDELDGLTPPLTRIVNRRPALRAAVHRGDEATVAIQLAGYVGRNFDDRRRAARERARWEDPDGLGGEGAFDGLGGAAGPVGFDGRFDGRGDAAGVPGPPAL